MGRVNAMLVGCDCAIVIAMAAEFCSVSENTTWQEPAATLVGDICVAVTALAAKVLEMVTELFWCGLGSPPPFYTGKHVTMWTYISPTITKTEN